MAGTGIESKVYAGTIGAGAGTAIGSFLLWLAGVLIWNARGDATHAADAVAAVPSPVSGIVLVAIAAVGSFTAGYFARHTPRLLDTVIPTVDLGDGEAPVPDELNAPTPDEPIDPADTTNTEPDPATVADEPQPDAS